MKECMNIYVYLHAHIYHTHPTHTHWFIRLVYMIDSLGIQTASFFMLERPRVGICGLATSVVPT